MKCKDIEFSSYGCAYAIYLPYKVEGYKAKFSKEGAKLVMIDKCLLPEILGLWEKGIKTTGCCCGHNKLEPFISVRKEFVKDMEEMGYKHQENKYCKEDNTHFSPKTKLDYSINKYNKDWCDEIIGNKWEE